MQDVSDNTETVTNAAVSLVSEVQQRSDAVQAFIQHHMVDSDRLVFLWWTIPLPPFLTAHGVMVIFSATLLILLFAFGYRRGQEVPHGLSNLLESVVQYIRDEIVIRYLGPEDGRWMAPMFLTFFFFILTMNLVGLVPAFSSATANLSVTAPLAVTSMLFMVVGAMWRHGPIGYIKGFIPHGVPWPLLLIVVPIEIFGVFIKSFALMIRLFANMLAGHIVVYSLLGMLIIYGWMALPLAMLAVLIYLLDVFVAIFQAYIFTLLSAVFIGQRYHPDH
jgi:F-type H+-transporting ATPase subunit a